MEKLCSNCKELKSLDNFHKLKKGKLGRHSHCKECRSKHRKLLNYDRPTGHVIRCLKCNEIKSQTMFYRNKSSSLGVQTYCIKCHKEKVYESQSKLSGFITKIYNKMLKHCLKYNIECNVSNDDIVKIYFKQNGHCALTNELMTYYIGPNLTNSRYESKYNIAIDRIETDKGYVQDNIQLIGHMIYQMKTKTSMNNEQFIKLCELISKNNLNL